MVSLTIDGNLVQAEERTPLIKIAERLGIRIPTLCYHPALEPYGACRLCTVEVVRKRRSKLVTACNYPAEEGIVVYTNSERVTKARKLIIELLLSRCSKAKIIQELAEEYGVKKPRFGEGDEDCILCGLCVRVCSEIVGVNAISFTSRGIDREVSPPFHIASEECIGCGACAYLCPTDAIKLEDIGSTREIKRWVTSRPLQRCSICGNYFVPIAQVEYIKKRLTLPEEIFQSCPNCRRKAYAEQIAALGHI